ncbi:MAG: cellulase family glycosylhydrolase [Oscillospiraceae bacterium]|nr:cellulase family glycosylhydrolase [Oscillospiraceae bacterium]
MKIQKALSTVCAFVMSAVLLPQVLFVPECAEVSAAESGPVSYYGQLQASGNRIIGSSYSEPVQVKGMSFFWSNWQGQYWNSGTVDRMVNEFKCEILRCSLGVDDQGSIYSGGDVGALRSVMDAAIAKDIYVIVDWHSHGAHNNPNAAKSFFSEIARDYGQYDNVIFELYNEPTQVSWSTVKGYAEQVIPEIRKYSDNLILVGTPTWSQDVDQAAYDPINDSNVAYVLHFYAGTHGGDLRGKGDAALNKNVAVFVSEWGTVNADGDGSVNVGSSEQWLSWMDSNKLSWCNWAISSKAEGSSIFGGDGSSLTEAGNYLKKILNAHAETAVWRTVPKSGTDPDPQTTEPDPQTQNRERLALSGSGSTVLEAESYTSMSGVELEDCAQGGKNVGYIESGDWMSYSISVPQAMKYELTLDAASESGGGQIAFSCGGNTLGTLNIPATGGWQNWQQFKVTLELPAGDSDLKLYAQQGGFNVDRITFTAAGSQASGGDINRDGNVSAADAVMLQKWLLGAGNLTDPEAADLNGDHKINAVDLTLLKRRLLRQ